MFLWWQCQSYATYAYGVGRAQDFNAKFQTFLLVDGVNNKIMALQQEIAELKATTNNLAVSSSTIPMNHSCACDNIKEPKISMPKKFDGMKSKFYGFVMQIQFLLLQKLCESWFCRHF